MEWKNKIAIVGIGETNVGVIPEKTSLQMYAEVSLKAIKDAGLCKADIDGVITAGSMLRPYFMHNVVFAEYMGLKPSYSTCLQLGGMGHCHAIMEAANAINHGMCETVLIVAADPLYSSGREAAITMMSEFFNKEFELPYGFVTPAMFALAAERHSYEYGTTKEQLAQIAVSMRRHASLNHGAHYRDLITIEDVLSSKEICSPLNMLDCSPVSDGGGAIILTTVEKAKHLRKTPVYLLGGGEGHEYEYTNKNRDLTRSAAIESGKKAFNTSGLNPSDMDFAQIYDCFTITLLINLEDLGFCKKGEGGSFVEGGTRIGIGGQIPINTHGGLLSHGHPGVPAGIFHITEAVKQLRGEVEEARQVRNAKVGLVHGNSGMLRDTATIILGSELIS